MELLYEGKQISASEIVEANQKPQVKYTEIKSRDYYRTMVRTVPSTHSQISCVF